MGTVFSCLNGSDRDDVMETAGEIALVDGGVVVLMGVEVMREPLVEWIPVATLDDGMT